MVSVAVDPGDLLCEWESGEHERGLRLAGFRPAADGEQGQVEGHAGVHAGMELIAIDGVGVARLRSVDCLTLLRLKDFTAQTTKRQRVLTLGQPGTKFRGKRAYQKLETVECRDSPGILLRTIDGSQSGTILKSYVKVADGSKGPVENHEGVSLGMELVAVSSEDVSALPYESAMKVLNERMIMAEGNTADGGLYSLTFGGGMTAAELATERNGAEATSKAEAGESGAANATGKEEAAVAGTAADATDADADS